MFVSKKKYNELFDKYWKLKDEFRKKEHESNVNLVNFTTEKERNRELTKEIERVVNENHLMVKDAGCEVGEWCKDCIHCGYAFIEKEQYATCGWYLYDIPEKKLIYCKKHIHEICSEFEKMK